MKQYHIIILYVSDDNIYISSTYDFNCPYNKKVSPITPAAVRGRGWGVEGNMNEGIIFFRFSCKSSKMILVATNFIAPHYFGEQPQA